MEPIFWSLILIGLGFSVVILELFVPSAGVLGGLAAVLLISGIVLAFMSDLKTGALMLLITVLALPLLLALMVKVWPSTPIGRRILIGRMTEEEVLPQSQHFSEVRQLVGMLGVAKTKMLPSGMIVINGKKYDAVSDGFAIDPGQPIKVVDVKGNRILVQPYDGKVDDLPVRDEDVLSQPIENLGLDSGDGPLGQ
jgi:membrane-bound serine protease (ClpP class)